MKLEQEVSIAFFRTACVYC